MKLEGISEENKQIEKDIMEELFRNIDLKQSIIFNSGAGAGKTYTLIECLRYIINKYGRDLNEHNQHVACITYTNVAVNQIKEKLGNSDIVRISTIHERIWSFINQYQKQLVEIHTVRIKNEITKIQKEFITSERCYFYQVMNEDERSKFKKIMIRYRNDFVQAYTLGAKEFKKRMPKELDIFPDIMKNVNNFKNVVNMIYRLERLEDCLQRIHGGELKKVEYSAMYNQDRLEKMRISHDTVLEYGLIMVEKYPVLRQIIIDQFPYFLIDEYQDTSEDVVKIMNLLDEYGKEIGHTIFVGYYGDMVQNIYSDGVGKNLKYIHHNLLDIKKQFNRRSFQEIITVANRIRKDEIDQVSIYDKCTGGTIKFYSGAQTDVNQFIDYYAQKWNIDKTHPLHCFFTTNKLVVEYSGFLHFYESIKKTEAYSGARYEQLNTELLSNELMKLGEIPRLLYRLMHLYIGLKQEQTPMREILLNEEMYNINISNLRELIALLRERNGKTLGEILQSIFSTYSEQCGSQFYQLVDIIFDMKNATYLEVKKYIQESLFRTESDDEKIEEAMECLFSTSIEELENWYYYVSLKKDDKKEKIYHTYHGTKGLEYENVIIVMDKGFGREKNYFENFFKLYGKKLQDEDLQLYESARNLLYVAVTRAIKNLRILYVDDIQPIEESVKKIFGEIGTTEQLNLHKK